MDLRLDADALTAAGLAGLLVHKGFTSPVTAIQSSWVTDMSADIVVGNDIHHGSHDFGMFSTSLLGSRPLCHL